MPIARLNGTELSYTERGAGEPVVLVHGTLGDLRSWEPQICAFADDHRVISHSRRYHHPNRAGKRENYNEAVLEFLASRSR